VSAKSLTFSIVARTRAPVGQRNRRRGATAECEVVTMMAMVIVLRRHQAHIVIIIVISVTIIIAHPCQGVPFATMFDIGCVASTCLALKPARCSSEGMKRCWFCVEYRRIC
jgi:hypothetical protein